MIRQCSCLNCLSFQVLKTVWFLAIPIITHLTRGSSVSWEPVLTHLLDRAITQVRALLPKQATVVTDWWSWQQGQIAHVLFADRLHPCADPWFSVEGKNEERGAPGLSYLRKLYVTVDGITVTLMKDRKTLVSATAQMPTRTHTRIHLLLWSLKTFTGIIHCPIHYPKGLSPWVQL